MTIEVHMVRAHDDNDVIDQVMWVVCEGALTEHAQLVGLHGWLKWPADWLSDFGWLGTCPIFSSLRSRRRKGYIGYIFS